jgi:hypothetical protein
MKSEIDEAMALFFREGDEIGEQNHPVRQASAPESDGEQLWLFETWQSRVCFRRNRGRWFRNFCHHRRLFS